MLSQAATAATGMEFMDIMAVDITVVDTNTTDNITVSYSVLETFMSNLASFRWVDTTKMANTNGSDVHPSFAVFNANTYSSSYKSHLWINTQTQLGLIICWAQQHMYLNGSYISQFTEQWCWVSLLSDL